MSNFIYEVYQTFNGSEYIKKTDTDGKEWFIPSEPANSDYQTYLEHLTEATESLL